MTLISWNSHILTILATGGLVFSLAAPRGGHAQEISTGGMPVGGDQRIVGSWLQTISPATGAASSNSVATYHADGTEEQSTFGGNSALTVTTAHGAWAELTDGTYAITHFRIQRDADGNQNVRRTRLNVSLDAGADTMTGTYLDETFDAAGAVVVSNSGTLRATRIGVVPIEERPSLPAGVGWSRL